MQRAAFTVLWRVYRAGARWLQDPITDRFFGWIAYTVDAGLEAIRLAAFAHLLDTDVSPPDALAAIGRERGIERAPRETQPAYRARLLNAWDIWFDAGSRLFAWRAFEPLGFALTDLDIHYEADEGWSHVDPTNWSKIWIQIESGPISRVLCGEGRRCGDGISAGSSLSGAEVRYAIRALHQFRAAHEGIVDVVYDPFDRLCGGGAVCGSVPAVTCGSVAARWRLGRLCGAPALVCGGAHYRTGAATIVCGFQI